MLLQTINTVCDGYPCLGCYECDPPDENFDKCYQFPIHVDDMWMLHEPHPWCWCEPDEYMDNNENYYYIHKSRN